MSLKSERSIPSETEISRITIGLTWRSAARSVMRLRQFCSIIEPEYSDRTLPHPRLYVALVRQRPYLGDGLDHEGPGASCQRPEEQSVFVTRSECVALMKVLSRRSLDRGLLVPPGKHPSLAKKWVREGMVIAWRTLSEFSVLMDSP